MINNGIGQITALTMSKAAFPGRGANRRFTSLEGSVL
jgi:hypothetical protein